MCQVWSLQESSKVLYKKLKHESFYLQMYLNRRDIGIVSRAENNGERKKRTTVDSKLTSRREMGDLHLDRSMLQTHYRSEDSHRGPFKASDRNLSSSDLKCRLGVRDGNGIAVGSDLQQTLPTGACRPSYQPSHRRVSSWGYCHFWCRVDTVGSRYPTDRGQISNAGQETEGQAF